MNQTADKYEDFGTQSCGILGTMESKSNIPARKEFNLRISKQFFADQAQSKASASGVRDQDDSKTVVHPFTLKNTPAAPVSLQLGLAPTPRSRVRDRFSEDGIVVDNIQKMQTSIRQRRSRRDAKLTTGDTPRCLARPRNSDGQKADSL